MTILESLKSINGYPVPLRTLTEVSVRRGLSLADEYTQSVTESTPYRLARADIMKWVSFAPNIQQGGESYTVLSPDRERLRKRSNAIYGELGDEAYLPDMKTKFGYKGNRL